MTTALITFDAQEAGRFADQHDAFVHALQRRGLVVTRATGREGGAHGPAGTETVIHLLDSGMELTDAVAEIRSAAGMCLYGALPDLTRHLLVYGPQGQHLFELDIRPGGTV